MRKRLLILGLIVIAGLILSACGRKPAASEKQLEAGYDQVTVGMSESEMMDKMWGISPGMPGRSDEEGVYVIVFRGGEGKAARFKIKDGKVISKELGTASPPPPVGE